MDNLLTTLNYFLAGNYNIVDFNSKNGKTICGFDDFIGMKYESDSRISNYTVQFGDFNSYNKVIIPKIIEITLVTQGTHEKISNVVEILENYKNSTKLVDVQTPYGVFIGYNIINLSYELSVSKGIGYLECTIKIREVGVSSAQFTAFKNIEEQPTTLLGKISSVRDVVQLVEKTTQKITTTMLGADIIFSNRILFR